ncbi:MAG TPA: carboxypeptidase regulatory-like domain-containing protein [Microbacteriaceae bacterium]|nr:carboxypeptidase regulatory-like domain-containing protein [Microbacteriaceae bacterium]
MSGIVYVAGTSTAIPGATVTASVNGAGVGPVNADTNGRYTLPAVPVGDAVITAIAAGHSTDSRPVRLTAGQNVTGENLFLVAKQPAKTRSSIAGAVVLTSDREDGMRYAGELTLTQNGKTLQSTTATDGAFVFEDVTARGDLHIVVAALPSGYEQLPADGFVYNFAGTKVDHLTIRLTPTSPPDPTPTPAAPDVTWLVIVLVALVVAAAIVITVLLVRRRRA